MKDILTIRTLGTNGRLGNACFQYSLGKALAKKFNCELQVPADWIGRKIFEVPEAPISVNLPQTPLDKIPDGPGWDLFGYWQYSKALDLYSRTEAKEWLQFKYPILDVDNELKYAAIHQRLGDYKGLIDKLCIPTDKAYMRALDKYIPVEYYVMWISEDTANERLFTKAPFTNELSFMNDFIIMMKASYLIRSNSTFSYWAHVLADKQQKVFSPNVFGKIGYQDDIDFVEGNHSCCVSFPNGITQTNLVLKD